MAIDRTTENKNDANTKYFDAALRHAIAVRQFTSGEVKRMIKMLEKADQELSFKLRRKLASLAGKPANFTTLRWKALIADIKDARKVALGSLSKELKPVLRDLGKIEIDFEQRIVEASLPIEVEFAAVSMERFNSRVFKKPFSGGTASVRSLNQWFDGLRQVDQNRLIEALQMGMIQGESVDDMMRRVAGTRSKGFSDGVLALTRLNAETVVRTAVNHVSNSARELFWDSNKDVIPFLRWTSTLDGRTSAVCRGRDGRVTSIGDEPIPDGEPKLVPAEARPPAHPNCRSIMVAAFSVDGVMESVGERPFVRGNKRQIDFRQKAKDKVGEDGWKQLTPKERNGMIRDVKQAWGRANIGQVPAGVSYQEWLKRQPAAFQDEVLGKTKGKLFRNGGLTLDRFLDRKGNELNLGQLAKKDPTAFTSAGLDPEDF